METKKMEYWKRIVILLFLGWGIIWVYRTMLTPVYAEIQGTIGLHTGLQMGLISSTYFMGYTFTQIPGGILMDKLGKKRVMMPAFLFFILGIVVIGFAKSIEMIYAGSLMAGIGTGTYYSGAFSLSGENVPPKYKYFATAMINNGCAMGMMIGYLSSGFFVTNKGLPWQSVVFVTAIFAVAITVAFGIGLKDDRPMVVSEEEKQAHKVPLSAFFKKKMIATYAFYFSTCYGYYMIVTWLPSFLATERGIEGSAASVYACIVAAVSIPGALFLGKVLDKFSKKRVILMLGLQVGSAIMLYCVTQLTVIPLMMLCLGIYGLCGKQAIDPLVVPHISGYIPEGKRSTGLGIFNFFGMSGSVLAPSITGYVEDIYGSKIYGFYIAGILLVVSATVFYMTNRKLEDN